MPNLADVVCFSHLRWKFVFQRPQHLMTRYAREARVFFMEEPVFGSAAPEMRVAEVERGVRVYTPHLPANGTRQTDDELQRALVARLADEEHIHAPVCWFYTPMAQPIAVNLDASLVVYDCMDELSAFLGAPPELVAQERRLFDAADIVFTGGQSLYEAKRLLHPNAHAFPSSVDAAHFRAARGWTGRGARRPRVGFFGVIDERLDIALLDGVARERPDVDFVMVGPVVKVDKATLPQRSNIIYLGPRDYDTELPACIAEWDVAMMPFARNDATRFISPTKTLEYMAAGMPVISTSIRDVVRPYGDAKLVRIADEPGAFSAAIDEALGEDRAQRLAAFDVYLAGTSWDRTWRRMRALLLAALAAPAAESTHERCAEGA